MTNEVDDVAQAATTNAAVRTKLKKLTMVGVAIDKWLIERGAVAIMPALWPTRKKEEASVTEVTDGRVAEKRVESSNQSGD